MNLWNVDRPVEVLASACCHAKRIRAQHSANASQRVGMDDLRRRSTDVRFVSDASCHDKVKWRAIDGTSFLARFLLAILTSHQFCVELAFGHDQGIWMFVHSRTSLIDKILIVDANLMNLFYDVQ